MQRAKLVYTEEFIQDASENTLQIPEGMPLGWVFPVGLFDEDEEDDDAPDEG